MDADELPVTVAELTTYMSDLNLSIGEADAAATVLEGVIAELETYCNRSLMRAERTEILRPDGRGLLWPSHTPVWSVATTGMCVGDTATVLTGGAPYGPPIEVTYTAGRGVKFPANARLAVLRVAAREMTVRHDDTMTVRNLETQDAEPADDQPLGFTDAELRRFDRFRRRTAV